MVALTRPEARRRAESVDVDRYTIGLDLAEPGDFFTSTTTIVFTAREAETFVELLCEELLEVVLDGAAQPVEAFAGGRLPVRGLRGRHELLVRARMRYSQDGEGLHRFVDPADGGVYLCATSSVDNAKRWFACFDQPDLKARVSVRVQCPPEWTVVGNGAATRTGPGAWRLAETEPISTYLVALVAGPWHSVLGEHDGIPLGLHVRRSLAAELDRDAAELLRLTADSLDVFHELFEVRYPFGEYHQAFVPEFNWGAMENPGCVTFRDQLIFRSRPSESELLSRANTVVHEMAHMWFGDLVTMRWWDDLWLNESFAEYLARVVTPLVTGLPAGPDFAAARKSWGYAADRRATTHPVAGNGATDARAALDDFDGISYAKGASVLRQLAAYLGEDMFLGGLREHVRSHAYGNATFADLLASWSAQAGPGTPTGADLARWAHEWLRLAGVDVVTVETGPSGTVLRRHPPEFGPAADRPHAMTVTVLPGGGAPAEVVLGDAPVPVPTAGPGEIVLPSAGDETWATIRLAADQWERLPAVMAVAEDATARAVAWNALRTGLADGLVPPELAARTVAAGLPNELDVVTARLLPWITAAVPVYLAPGAERAAAITILADATWALLADAKPGGSMQLTAARGWVGLTDDLDALRGWHRGGEPLGGLTVDDELSWLVLERRAALGDLTPDQIETAYAADRTASGLVHAARCRALRPDPDAKAAAWAELIDPASTMSHYQLSALAGGIWVAGQEDLAAPYARRWFDDLPATAEFRGTMSLARLAELCFPALAVAPETLAWAERFAARTDIPSGLRRTASDGADDLRRALAVRGGAARVA
ncbi:aminopeptidase N [Frankia nepalensis]|uniref:aminopeptidase N n=1 Tax=Frankia nepalensis TaxID=1836974 RepID=UPI001EE3FAE7|nr:aminopeptidase N [Frankia nepalensis]